MNNLLLALALAVAAPGVKDKDKAKTPQKLDGSWVVEVIEGKGDNAKEKGPTTFTFEDGKVKIKEGMRDRSEDAAYTADATQKPPHIDIKPDRNVKDVPVLGIYEIDGDTLKICFTFGGGDRPKEFKADPDKMTVLVVLKRVKGEK